VQGFLKAVQADGVRGQWRKEQVAPPWSEMAAGVEAEKRCGTPTTTVPRALSLVPDRSTSFVDASTLILCCLPASPCCALAMTVVMRMAVGLQQQRSCLVLQEGAANRPSDRQGEYQVEQPAL
jgi:hypothetical protein